MPCDSSDAAQLFSCRQCGDCCKGYGGTYVSEQDIEAISRYIGTQPQYFIERYCDMSGKRPLLAQKEDGYCIFWDQLCTIHPVKPRMCRAWPFIESILLDPRNWRIMADSCPGIRADVPLQQVEQCVRRILASSKKPQEADTDKV